MKREIQITKDVRRELINQFGTTRKTLHQALNYLGRSELLEHIRNEALRQGGVVVITAPEEEVLLDMGDKLVQRLCNDVLIEFDKTTGDANIYKGKELRSTHHAVIASLASIQEFGKTL